LLRHSGGVSAEVLLFLLERDPDQIRRELFRFDTGADVSIVPGMLEPKLNLDSPGVWETVRMKTAVGVVQKRICRGRFRARLPGFGEEEFEWPCLFEADNSNRYLLGMAGVINGPSKRLKITLDGTPSGVSFPVGRFTVEVIREQPSPSPE